MDKEAAARIQRAEARKFGSTLKSGFAARAQSAVDRNDPEEYARCLDWDGLNALLSDARRNGVLTKGSFAAQVQSFWHHMNNN